MSSLAHKQTTAHLNSHDDAGVCEAGRIRIPIRLLDDPEKCNAVPSDYRDLELDTWPVEQDERPDWIATMIQPLTATPVETSLAIPMFLKSTGLYRTGERHYTLYSSFIRQFW